MFRAVVNLVAVCSLAAAGVQTARIEGWKFGHVHVLFVNFWLVNVEGYKQRLASADAERAAEKAARLAAIAALKAAEAKSLVDATETQHAYETALVDADSRTRSWIAAHRLRNTAALPAAGGEQTDAAPGSDEPGDSAFVVAANPADIEQCTINTERLKAVHDLGLQWIEDGLAVKAH